MMNEPIDMSMRAPRDERLEQLAQDVYETSYAELSGDNRVKIYQLGLGEMQVSALSVLAQFCAGAR